MAVARSSRFEDLPETVRTAWKLKPESYLDLKAATDTPERRDNLHAKLAQAFEPLLQTACSAPKRFPSTRMPAPFCPCRHCGPSVGGSPGGARPRCPRTDHQARRRGLREFKAAFTAPRIGQVLFELVADRVDRGRRSRTSRRRPPGSVTRPAAGSKSDTTPTPAATCWSKQGQTIGDEQLILLRLEHEQARKSLSLMERVRRGLGILALVAALFLLTVTTSTGTSPRSSTTCGRSP